MVTPRRPPCSGGQTLRRGQTGHVADTREEGMKKLAFCVALALAVVTGAAYAELDALKGLGKEAGKSLKQSGQDTALAAVTRKLKKVQNEKGPIKFKTGKSEIDPACDRTMAAIAAIMIDYPGFHVQVDGHTDNVGNPDANRKLSQDRAEAVVKYLVDKKAVDGKRLSGKGFGDSKPIADNKTKAGQAKNRRVDFTVTQM
jgi:outer membrane protein OmpA-like peptidoglycan-associated protein